MSHRNELTFSEFPIPDHIKQEFIKPENEIHSSFLPLLVDDRSHVRALNYLAASEEEENENEKTRQQQKFFPFTQFYSGNSSLSFNNKQICGSMLLFHSLLRMNNNNSQQTEEDLVKLFDGKQQQQQHNNNILIKEILNDKIGFVKKNFSELFDCLMPVLKTKNQQQEEQQPTKTTNASSSFFIYRHQKEKEQEKDGVVLFFNTSEFISIDDVAEFLDHPELLDRLLFSYSILLSNFGWRLHDFQTGTVDRISSTWKSEYELLEKDSEKRKSCCIQSVTRMLRCLIDFRLRKIAIKLVHFIWEELCGKRLSCLRNVWEHVWVPMVLVSSQDPETKEWIFDETQKQVWLKKLKAVEENSSDDE
jgi:hypothetical protein